MAFSVGDSVKILAPFAISFPGTYQVLALAQAPDTYTVDIYNDGIGSDFYVEYLEAP